MNLLNLLNNLDLDSITEALNNNDSSNIVNKLDFTKKEDLDKLIDAVDTFKNTNDGIIGLGKMFLGSDWEDTLDAIVGYAQKVYEDNQKKKIAATTAPVISNLNREVKDKTVGNTNKLKDVSRPSANVPEELQKKFADLVLTYVHDKIMPSSKLTDEQLNSVCDGLYEFACWIYTR